jgi:dihydrofolate synthase/folylpolyglutamate synthase
MTFSSAIPARSTFDRIDDLNDWGRRPRMRMAPMLAPMHDLIARLGNPHRAFSVVHVTGTKGKGSVCALIEAALHAAGVRVGRYASPHVHSICERVSIRGRNVDEDLLSKALERALDARDEACAAGTPAQNATWFDVMTAAAFLLFAQANIAWAVVEVGLGGRLDSTNVADGTICVVTNIALEHTEVLGNSLVRIAQEKGGIIKHGSIVVSGIPRDCEPHTTLLSIAQEQQATLVTVDSRTGITQRNMEIARTVLDNLGKFGVRDDAAVPVGRSLLSETLAQSARLPGRIEIIETQAGNRPLTIVLDGAHVDIALRALLEELATKPFAAEPMIVLFALGRDKNPSSMLGELRGRAEHIIFASLGNQNCWVPDELSGVARELGISHSIANDLQSAFNKSFEQVRENGWILATGSLHLIAPAREAMAKMA